MKKTVILFIAIAAVALLVLFFYKGIMNYGSPVKYAKSIIDGMTKPPVKVEKIVSNHDQDGDGILDLDDIVEGARKDAERKPKYKSAYYDGGYPPDSEGVCTDVIWRALKNTGYDLKSLVDGDISKRTADYPRVEGKPDPNIDFRRVPNLLVFFREYAESLTLEIKPYDVENLKQWQGGDIVVFKKFDHIGIISDQRRRDGVPYLIHNGSPYTKEADVLMRGADRIVGHFRFPKAK